MAINFKSFSQLSTVLALLLSSSLSFATDCYVESPGLEALGDDYYNLDLTQDLNREERTQIKHFFNALDGDWKGTSTLMDCRGPDSKPRKVYKDYEVTADFMNRSDAMHLKLIRGDAEQKITKHDHFPLYIAADLYTIEFEDDSPVVISHKARRVIQLQKNTQLKNLYQEYEKIKQQILQLQQQVSQITKTVKELKKELATLNSDSKQYKNVQQRITQNELEFERLLEEIERLKQKLENINTNSDNKNIKKYSRLVEKTVEISLNNNHLKLTFLHFNNGIFVAKESFQLYRQ